MHSNTPNHDLPVDSTVVVQLEEAVARFEAAWREGQRPEIEAFLPKDPAAREAALLELVHADLEFRIKAGEEARVEGYLEQFPQLREPATLVELLSREYTLRCRGPESVPVEDYLARFPQLRAELVEKLRQEESAGNLSKASPGPLRLNCPHCRNPIELVDDGSPELICPACGSTFRVEATLPQTWSPQRLPQLGRFQLLEPVGRGSFGTVYRARDTQLDRIVAVKVPRSGRLSSAEDQSRFVREARNAARLQHPGIVPVYEVGESETFPFIVSEFVEGVTLADFLTGRRMSFREAADTLWQAAMALDHAHSQGVIHRDLKPSNLLLQTTGLDSERRTASDSKSNVSSSTRLAGSQAASPETPWRVRIMDFGLARRDEGEPTVTMEGQVLGTPAYMSPEQARGDNKHVDRQSDVYSLGVILYELLTGELPFRGNQRMLLHQVLRDDPRPPRHLNDRIPRDLETIALRSMSKEPARRYARAVDLADDLRRWLCGEPIVSRPITRLERGWRWCRRNPAISVAAGTIVTAIIAVVAILTVSVIKISASAEAERVANLSAQRKAVEERQQRALAERHQRQAEQERQAAIQSQQAAVAAQQREAAQRREAQQSQQNAVAANAFLVEVFDSTDPLGLRSFGFRKPEDHDGPLTARAILDRGRQRVEAELANQPLVQASLFDALGLAYLGQGALDVAGPLLDRARTIREARLPADHPDVLASLWSQAFLKLIRSEVGEAEALLRKVLAGQQKWEDCPPLTLARTQFYLGVALVETYRGAEAEPLFRAALATRERELGARHQDTLLARIMLVAVLVGRNEPTEVGLTEGLELAQSLRPDAGIALFTGLAKYWQVDRSRRRGDWDQAVAACRALRGEAQAVLGDGHPLIIVLEFEYAGLLQRQGNYAEAEDVARQALQRLPRVIANNPRVAEPHLKLAQFLASRGEMAEAEEHFRAAARIGGSVQVKEHFWGLEAALALAHCKQRQGDLPAAEQLCRDLLQRIAAEPSEAPLARAALHALHDSVTGCLISLLIDQYQTLEAVALARPRFERRWAERRQDSMAAIAESQNFATCLREQGDHAAMLRVDADRRALAEEVAPKVQPGFGAGGALHLASVLQEQDDLPGAEKLVRLALQEARQRCKPGHPELAGFLFAAGVFLRDCGSAEEGRELLAESLRYREGSLGPKHWDTINTQLAIALAENTLRHSDQALELARQAYEASVQAYGRDSLELGPAMEVLARLLADAQEFDEAEALQRQRLTTCRNQLAATHPQSWQATLDLGDLLLLKADAAAATTLLSAAHEQFATVLPGDSWRLAEINGRLGACHSARGEYPAAEMKLLASLIVLESAWGPRHVRVRQANERLASHYEAAGDKQAADRYRAKLANH